MTSPISYTPTSVSLPLSRAAKWSSAIDTQLGRDAQRARDNGGVYSDYTTLAWAYLAFGPDHDFKDKDLALSRLEANLTSTPFEAQAAYALMRALNPNFAASPAAPKVGSFAAR